MSENSKIEWCDHTYNAWVGCTKVSPGCANCYAEQSTRARVLRARGKETWGLGEQRSRTLTQGDPVKWNKVGMNNLKTGGRRPRVFCASLSDWLDGEVPIEWLADLLELIRNTPNLDWLLLTKRPENFVSRLEAAQDYHFDFGDRNVAGWLSDWRRHGIYPTNVWIGTTVEDQRRAADRIPTLLKIPAAVRFLSCEPMLGQLDLEGALSRGSAAGTHCDSQGIDWLIAGGESGPNARPMHPDWACSLRDQCQTAGVPFLFKQWGEWMPISQMGNGIEDGCSDSPKLRKAKRGVLQLDGSIHDDYPKGAMTMFRVGKVVSGRLLDGREWNEYPNNQSITKP